MRPESPRQQPDSQNSSQCQRASSWSDLLPGRATVEPSTVTRPHDDATKARSTSCDTSSPAAGKVMPVTRPSASDRGEVNFASNMATCAATADVADRLSPPAVY